MFLIARSNMSLDLASGLVEGRMYLQAKTFAQPSKKRPISQIDSDIAVVADSRVETGLSEADVETFLLEWTNGGDGEAYLEELDASISDHIPLNQVFRDDCFQF